VNIAELAAALQLEAIGEAVVAPADESFCHEGHASDYSLLPTDDDGNAMCDKQAPKGPGSRLCLAGLTTGFGSIVCHYDADHPLYPGEAVRHCDWRNGAGESVDSGGTYYELDNDGNPRALYGKLSGVMFTSTSTVAELRSWAALNDVPTAEPGGTKLINRTELYRAVKEKRDAMIADQKQRASASDASLAPSAALSGKAVSAKQLLNVDWDAYRTSLADTARTTDMMFPANKSSGDYHDNFDSQTWFKWIVSLEHTYPEWCKEMQRRFEEEEEMVKAGKLSQAERFAQHGFYNWVLDRPTRQLILFIDNAPYHKSITCQLSDKNKDELAEMLRDEGITQITIPRAYVDDAGGAESDNYLVPRAGVKWVVGKPSLPQLKAAVASILKIRHPQLLEPPYFRVIRDLNDRDAWGPGDNRAFRCHFTCPYTSTWIPVELRWADGKNYVGNPKNRRLGQPRSLPVVARQLRQRWYSDVTTGASLFEHCKKEINAFIASDIEEGESPFTCDLSDLDAFLASFTSEQLNEWKELCGMEKDGMNMDDNDTMLCGFEAPDGSDDI
jgi:hypothetical protein